MAPAPAVAPPWIMLPPSVLTPPPLLRCIWQKAVLTRVALDEGAQLAVEVLRILSKSSPISLLCLQIGLLQPPTALGSYRVQRGVESPLKTTRWPKAPGLSATGSLTDESPNPSAPLCRDMRWLALVRVTWEEKTSLRKCPPLDWPMGHFLN